MPTVDQMKAWREQYQVEEADLLSDVATQAANGIAKAARVAGVTPAQLAQLSGLSGYAVRKALEGKEAPDLATLVRLAWWCGYTVNLSIEQPPGEG